MPSVLRDPAGVRVPYGRSRRRIEGNWLLGAHPAHLTAITGTATFSGLGTGNGFVNVATAAAVDSIARIETTFSVSLTRHRQIALTVEGLMLDTTSTTTAALEIGFLAGGAGPGASVRHDISTASANFKTAGTPADTSSAGYEMIGATANNSRNLTFMLRPGDKHAFLLADDQLIKAWDMSATNFATGVVKPFVRVIAKTATAVSMSMLAFNLDFEDNRPAP